MCDISNLTRDCGKTAGGTKAFAYLIPTTEITTFPAYLGTSGAGDSVTLDGGFTLVSTSGLGYWRKVEFDVNTGNIVSAPVGDDRANGFENTFTAFLAGITAKNKEFLNKLAGVPLVAIVPDKSGEHHVIGHPDDPAYLQPSDGLNSQTQVSEKAGIAFSVRATSSDVIPTYDAVTNALNLTPAA